MDLFKGQRSIVNDNYGLDGLNKGNLVRTGPQIVGIFFIKRESEDGGETCKEKRFVPRDKRVIKMTSWKAALEIQREMQRVQQERMTRYHWGNSKLVNLRNT